MKVYVNGALVSQNSYTGSLNTLDDVIIGSSFASFQDTDDFCGLIDDVRLYNRALSETEI
jgi:hypothetical protein